MYRISALLVLLVVLAVRPSHAHSFLTDPAPYNRVFKTDSCEGSECSQACPNILNRGMRNTESSPEKVWSRGQNVNIKWAKNNHRGGLMRMSIVPVDKMMDRTWHKKYAIYSGCWEQGQYTCSGELCGSDSDNEGFKRDIIIPTVIPDGNYVFGLVWYGGLHFSRDKGQFPDYFSCSYVEIRGGPLGGSYQPFFEDGDTGKYRRADGKCDTASDSPGECPLSGCTGRSFSAVSKPFQDGKKPAALSPSDYGASGSLPAPEPVSVPEEPVPEPEAAPPTSTDDRATPTESTPATTPEPASVTSGDMVCTGKVCCPATCGKCGGSGCNKRPGGGENCCFSKIKGTGRVCGIDAPPCVVKN